MIVKAQHYTNKEILYTFSATFCASVSAIFSSERPPSSPDIFLSLLGQSSCHQRSVIAHAQYTVEKGVGLGYKCIRHTVHTDPHVHLVPASYGVSPRG